MYKYREVYISDDAVVVVGFTTTYAISAYHHWRCEFESCTDEVY